MLCAVRSSFEDHYYDRSDAAVVFNYHDNHTNRTSYIYMAMTAQYAWNDTGQLNYLDPNVRERSSALLDVALRFPITALTLL
jgi:hypothetical protein